MSTGASPPSIAQRLTWLAVLAFGFGALLVWVVDQQAHPHATRALSALAAVVLAFLGGAHAALAMRVPAPPAAPFVWGTVLPLLAWLALLMPAGAALVVHGVLWVVSYLVDRRAYPAYGMAHWLTLRFRLSAVAALACFLAAAGS